MENNTRPFAGYGKKRFFTSFEYVGDEFFSLDDGMMMQFGFFLTSTFDFFFFIVFAR